MPSEAEILLAIRQGGSVEGNRIWRSPGGVGRGTEREPHDARGIDPIERLEAPGFLCFQDGGLQCSLQRRVLQVERATLGMVAEPPAG